MSKGEKFALDHARFIAESYVRKFEPDCERIEIAGSIRRQRPEVGDIEIVAIPKLRCDLFGTPLDPIQTELDDTLRELADSGIRFNRNGPRWKQLLLPEGIKLDLFLVSPPAQWGVIFALRTGPEELNKWLADHRPWGGLPMHLTMEDGAIWDGKEMLPMPEEDDFLHIYDLQGLKPEDRQLQVLNNEVKQRVNKLLHSA